MELSFTIPSRCAAELASRQADVGLIPAIEYQRIPGLSVLAGPCIASRRRARSILLLSRVPLDKVATVAADTSSRTSVALAELVLRCRYGRNPRMAAFPPEPAAMLAGCDAAVMIGDPALLYRQQPLPGVNAIDLGEEWRAWTGLPFVFAFWAALDEVATPAVARVFCEARDRGLKALDEIIEVETPRRGLLQKVVREYLTGNIHFHLDADCLAGLRRFYLLAAEHGLIESAREPRLVAAAAPAAQTRRK